MVAGILFSCVRGQSTSDAAQVVVCDGGHAEKGSWGESRIARVSYADDVLVKLARRSYELYGELSKVSAEPLMYKTGCLDVGFKRESAFLACMERCFGMSARSNTQVVVGRRQAADSEASTSLRRLMTALLSLTSD